MTDLLRVAVDGESHVALRTGPDAELVLLDPLRFPTVAAALAAAGVEDLLAGASPAPSSGVTRLAPVDPDVRVFCVAQNYTDHAREVSGTEAPAAPVLFLKPATALVGPDEDIALPAVTSFLDYEAELAAMIGRDGTVAAATCMNDGSARDLQPATLGGKPIIDWFSGKSLDRTGAVGPWLRLVDGVGALDDLAISCRVNGELVQDDRTSSMVHDIPRLLAFISSRVRLRPGDVVATGTPGGVGAGRGVSLQDGDVVEIEVEGVGRLCNTVRVVSAVVA